jgi:hypothetical protein
MEQTIKKNREKTDRWTGKTGDRIDLTERKGKPGSGTGQAWQ